MALVVYRFLTRSGVAKPVAVADAEVAGCDDSTGVAGDAGRTAAGDAADADDAAAAEAAAERVTDSDPDERIEALRRKLEAVRETPTRESPAPTSATAGPVAPAEPVEPPLDERRRAVHEAGRSAADAMRQAGERPGRSEQPGVGGPADGPADPASPADPAG